MNITNPKKLVVEADDLGLTKSFNYGILHSYQNGILQSTCIRTNGPAFKHAIQEILPQCPNIGIGVHLNLVEGIGEIKSRVSASRLYDASGNYKNSFSSLLIRCKLRDKKLLHEIETDYRIQIEKALSNGIRIDHLNSHQHSHVIPEIFRIVCYLAKEYGIRYVRLTRERFHSCNPLTNSLLFWYQVNLAKLVIVNKFSKQNVATAEEFGIKTNDYFIGITHAGHMDSDNIKKGLVTLDFLNPKLVEVLLHPCMFLLNEYDTYISSGIKSYVSANERQQELNALLDEDLISFINRNNWQLANYISS